MNITQTAIEFFNNAKKVYNLLEDDTSKDIFLNRLLYNVTDDVNYLDCMIRNHVGEFKDSGYFDFEMERQLDKVNKKVVIYGVGIWGGVIYKRMKKGNKIDCFCDRSKKKQNEGYCGIPVISPEELIKNKDEYVVVIGSTDFYDEIYDFLDNHEIEVLPLSLEVKKNAIVNEKQYFDDELISFSDNEIFVDAGCYNFKTSKRLLGKCNARIHAFEPNSNQYSRCLELTKDMENVQMYPYGLWNENVKLSFCDDAAGTEGHIVEDSEENTITIDAVRLDDVLDGEKVTFIKMDIEGAELNALEGARETILKYKPKLAICIYHKREDIIDIPLYIKSLVPEYKFYVRHYSGFEWETVLYAL